MADVRSGAPTVYLAGPGATHDTFFRRKFGKIQDRLECRGFGVVNMACALPLAWTLQEAMEVCYTAIDRCDVVLMLDGWEKSAGALLEYQYAMEKDVPVFGRIEELTEYFGGSNGNQYGGFAAEVQGTSGAKMRGT